MALIQCLIKELTGVADEDTVRIFLEYDTVEAASKAYETFQGRIFDGLFWPTKAQVCLEWVAAALIHKIRCPL